MFLSPATDSGGVGSCRRRGVMGWVPIDLHWVGEGKALAVFSLSLSLSLVAARVSSVVCLQQSCLLRELLPSPGPRWKVVSLVWRMTGPKSTTASVVGKEMPLRPGNGLKINEWEHSTAACRHAHSGPRRLSDHRARRRLLW